MNCVQLLTIYYILEASRVLNIELCSNQIPLDLSKILVHFACELQRWGTGQIMTRYDFLVFKLTKMYTLLDAKNSCI